MVDITLPPINITASEPGYPDVNTNGLPNPAPSPAVIFLMQQQSRNPYYAQGLWREMLIKLANEQLGWSQDGNVAPGFTYDLQVVPYADYYIFLHPGNDVNGALYYASTNYAYLTNGVSACPGLTGNQLTPVAAFGHFVYGHGAAAETSIANFGLNSSNFSSPLLDAALAAAPVGTVTPIVVESIPAVGSVSDWQLLTWIENTSFKVEGTVNKDAVGNYQFDGKISAGNITYNTIPENLKSAVGEAAATQLQYVVQNLNATPFEIVVKGDTPVSIGKQLTPDEIAAEQARQAAAAEAAAYKDAVSFVADTNERILEKYGANMSKIAQDLQAGVSGKKVRSYAEALATFERVSANPNIRLNAQDTQAVVDALNALDKATLADNIKRLGKGFGVVGKIVQAETVGEKVISGYQTGDWKPLMLELEAMAIGAGAGAVLAVGVAFALPAFASATAGIIIVSIAMAAAASYIDAEKVDEINNFFLN
ncbi:lipid II-degrading bacteriocin [Pseudomonas sp. BCA14]|uniref:lipid II-degrading bacteriocin n=1 Tax=unclassified Pseudomonas TaxID=196821 RepID=UPI00106DDDEB|nr:MULTISPECIES: lipid II-degrading bacteriocin [unclassified Pseudomonas]TFF14302.1 lipid II-degrading bacteriocin [Pseudomonas sp. JMN1]TFF15014.1 lipid II-degrading bacteriocin [Pseudomonas sp. BCA17]TFF31420.1 lipid II-degrading bacteriocin [Pseudomonas sp. BCA14]TFF32374.1 lipid II-degrading bacteriocin [Pseudomonas sp. BCA13]